MKIANLLLLCVPVAVVLERLAPGQHLWIFLASAAVYLIFAIIFYFAPGRIPQ